MADRMVGPVVKIDPGALPRNPNIRYIGQRTYQALPAYLAGWDVCLLPFARNQPRGSSARRRRWSTWPRRSRS